MILKNIRPYRQYLWTIGLIGFAVYLKSVSFGLSGLDDTALVAGKTAYLKNPSIFMRAFVQDVFHPIGNPLLLYRPLFIVSLAIDTILGNGNLFFYHFTNIVIHTAVSLLLYLFLAKLGYEKRLSFFFALIFAVHPSISQSVAWIPGRNDSLLALSLLSSMLALLNFSQSKRKIYYALHILFFASALFTKESGIVLPLICAYYIYILDPGNFTRRDKTMLIIGWAITAAVWGFFRYAAVPAAIPDAPLYIMKSAVFAIPSLVYYTGKVIFPFNLSVIVSFEDMPLAYGYIAVALIVLALIFSQKSRLRHCLFGTLWFAIFLLPALLYINSYAVISNLTEHRLYVPIIGLFIVLMETDIIKNIGAKKNLSKPAGTTAIVLLSFMTFFYIECFRNQLVFWENAVKAAPHSAPAHRALGEIYYLEGMTDMARQHLETAIALNPAEPMVHFRLGNLYVGQNKPDEAEREFRKEIAVNKNCALPYINLGVLYYKKGAIDAAKQAWEGALLAEPENDHAKKYLARIKSIRNL